MNENRYQKHHRKISVLTIRAIAAQRNSATVYLFPFKKHQPPKLKVKEEVVNG